MMQVHTRALVKMSGPLIFYSFFVKKGIDTTCLRVILNSTKRVKKKKKTQYNEFKKGKQK